MQAASRFFRAFIGIFSAAFLGLLLLAINVLQVSSMLLHPFFPAVTRRFNRELANFWWGLCVLLGTGVLGYEVVLSGDEVPLRENALAFANHQEMPDIFILMTFAKKEKRLGDLKFFVKDIIKYVPGIGWGMWMIDCIFLKRNWADDADRIQETFHKFTTNHIPFWVTFFPEGTRVRPHKLELSQRFAKAKGLPILHHVLLPRTKGFTTAITALRSQTQAVYDLTIAYEGQVPTLWSLLTGKSRRAFLHVRRFPVNQLPSSEKELASWLIQRFLEKDKLLKGLIRRPSSRSISA